MHIRQILDFWDWSFGNCNIWIGILGGVAGSGLNIVCLHEVLGKVKKESLRAEK